MGVCSECGTKFNDDAYIECDWSGFNRKRSPKPIKEVDATTAQCFNPDCKIKDKLQNWCPKCETWFLAEQPDRGDENIQCPYCRAEVNRIKAIEVINENN